MKNRQKLKLDIKVELSKPSWQNKSFPESE